MNRYALRPVNTRAVIGHDRKDGVGPERFLAGLAEKLPQRIVGVFDGVFASPLGGILGNFAPGIGERLVIGDREDGGEKGLSGGGKTAKVLHGALVKIFVADTPYGREGRVLEMFFFDKPIVAVAQRERAHAVEESTPAIQKLG